MSILSVKIAAKLSGAVCKAGKRRNFSSRVKVPAAAVSARRGGRIRRAGRNGPGRAKLQKTAHVPRPVFDSRRSRGIIGTAAML